MKLTDLKITDLITPDAKLTFLVGAGCSVDPPSNLPIGKTMMEALIRYTCTESEIDKLLGNAELEEGGKLEGLRFEQLIEIIRDNLDTDLRIIDFYGLCDKPNIQHLFLVEMIKNGQFVITTNFDFLIEYALQKYGVLKEQIKIIITKEDFENFSNPQNLFSEGVKALYKVHGSVRNIITEENTRKSLIATIRGFGANKEGQNVFQIESFKQPAFINLTKNRSLVVMGYSGSDDFDIVPTLKVLNRIQDVIWINYESEDKGEELIYEIEWEDINNYENLPKVNQILADIKRMNFAKHVFRVDVNTTRMVRKLIKTQPEISSSQFSIDIFEWLTKNIDPPDLFMKLYIPYKIYFDFDIYKDALSLLENMLSKANNAGRGEYIALALDGMGVIYKAQGKYPQALKLLEESLHIVEQWGDLPEKVRRLNTIGNIYQVQGKYSEALKRYKEALFINDQLEDFPNRALCLNNIGCVYLEQKNYVEALKRFEKVILIYEQLGDLSGKAMILNNFGIAYYELGNYHEALKRYEEALFINEQLGSFSMKAIRLNNIGMIFMEQGNYREALKRIEEALQISEQLGDLRMKCACLINIGTIYGKQGNKTEAIKKNEEALYIAEQLGDLSRKTLCISNIGSIYKSLGHFQEAIKHYQDALDIDEQSGNALGKAERYNAIGLIYNAQGNYLEAIKLCKKALIINEKLGNSSGQISCLKSIGVIFYTVGDYLESIKRYQEALYIAKQLGSLSEIVDCLNNMGTAYAVQGNYPEALKRYQEALLIDEQLENLFGKAMRLKQIGVILYHQQKYQDALKYSEEALGILNGLRLNDSSYAQEIKERIKTIRSKLSPNNFL